MSKRTTTPGQHLRHASKPTETSPDGTATCLPGLRYCGGEISTEKKARLSEIVSVDPDLMHGAPCFRGTRVPVGLLLDDPKSGCSIDEFLNGCPTASRELVEEYLALAQ